MANQQTAVAVIEQPIDASVVTWNLDDFPEDRFLRLLPMQSIVIPNDIFKPAYQVIVADPPDREGKSGDTYTSTDVPKGHRALTARMLRKIATSAGISFSDERRLDDGSDPDVLGVTMQASMVLPSGQRVSAPGSQLINLRTWFRADASTAEVAKFRKQFYANVATRAMNRAIRGLLGLRSSYPEAELKKPFLVVSYVLNMANAEVRQRVLDAAIPVTAQLYGGSAPAAPKQVGPGADEIVVDEAPEEDPAPAAEAEASTSEEPAWLRDEAPAGLAGKVDFATSLRDSAAAHEGGEAKADALAIAALKSIFEGWTGIGIVAGGFKAIWPDADVEKITAGQAHAIATAADAMGPEAFQAAWRAEAKAAAEAATA